MAAKRRAVEGSPSRSAQSRVCSLGSSLRAEPWPRFVCGPLRGPGRRVRPCGFGPQGLLCGLCALHAGAPLSARPRRQNGGRGLAWLVVRRFVGVPVLRAAAPPLLVPAWLFARVARGGPRRFFPEALAPGNARASGRFVRRGRCHGPCFSPLAKPPRLCRARLLW